MLICMFSWKMLNSPDRREWSAFWNFWRSYSLLIFQKAQQRSVDQVNMTDSFEWTNAQKFWPGSSLKAEDESLSIIKVSFHELCCDVVCTKAPNSVQHAIHVSLRDWSQSVDEPRKMCGAYSRWVLPSTVWLHEVHAHTVRKQQQQKS